MDTNIRKPIEGAIRYLDKVDNQHHIVEPGNAHYKDALYVADEYWNADRGEWVKISSGTTTGRMPSNYVPPFHELPRA